MNDDDGVAVALLLSVATFFGLGYGTGSTFSRGDYASQGRNEGIIYCLENKRKCVTEYNYLKLKENQNEL